jgi:small subunit ribosomal protein S6
MKNRYEALLVLDTKGKEEGAKEIIERLEGEFKKEHAKIEQVQKMGSHAFSYAADKLDGGFYANFIFEAEAPVIEKLKARLKLDEDVYRQHYQKLAPKKEKKQKAAKAE